jgi:hypothetical protein
MKHIWILLIPLLMAFSGSPSGSVSSGAASAPAGPSISEDGTSCANFTAITGGDYDEGISCSGGEFGHTTWHLSGSYHATAMSSVNHYVQADLEASPSGDTIAIYARLQSTTGNVAGYKAWIENGIVNVVCNSGAWGPYTYNGSYTLGTKYTVKLSVSGTNPVAVSVDVNGVNRISQTDATAERYQGGTRVGMVINEQNSSVVLTADNFEASAL